jgi:hypothetical protein
MCGALNAAAATNYTVNTTGDPGPAGTLSLRQALSAATSSNSIVMFDASLQDSTITLSQGVIVVTSSYNVYIEGPGSRHLTIAGNGLSPVLVFSSNPGKVETFNVSGVTVTNGRERSGSGIPGGGCILGINSALGLVDMIATGCSADDFGGGVLLHGGSLSVLSSTISGNTSHRGGGGIHAFAASGAQNDVYIYDSTISNNTTYGYGAGIYAGTTNHFRLTRSLISGNSVQSPQGNGAGGGGVALKTVYQQALIVDSTVTNNYTLSAGGGISLLDSGTASVTQVNFSTLTQNYSGFGYGGNAIHSSGSFNISNSILANNFNRYNNVDIDGTAAVSHSLILNIGSARVTGSYNIFNTDPALGPLAFNGGPTLTMLPKPGSPVLDAAGDPGTLSTDERGLPRHVGAASDMGAVERQRIEDEIFQSGFDSS